MFLKVGSLLAIKVSPAVLQRSGSLGSFICPMIVCPQGISPKLDSVYQIFFVKRLTAHGGSYTISTALPAAKRATTIKYLNIKLQKIITQLIISIKSPELLNALCATCTIFALTSQIQSNQLYSDFIYQLNRSQYQMQIEPTKFYGEIIKGLERNFIKNEPDEKLWTILTGEISSKLKMDITFDSRFCDAMREYFNQVCEKFNGTDMLSKKVKFINTLNNLAHTKLFISKRDYMRLRTQIQNILKSPCGEWIDELGYIKASESLREFREEFLIRLCKLPEEEVGNIMQQIQNNEELQRLKEQYAKFFRQCLQPNVPTRIANFVQAEWSQWQVKNEMLPADLIRSLEKHLGVDIGRTVDEIQINSILVNIAQQNSYQNDQVVQQMLQNEVKLIEKALQKFSGLNIIKQNNLVLRLGKFGSLISGFAGVDADLDLTILTNCYVNQTQFLKIIYQFLKKQYQEGDRRSSGRRAIPELILTAKTPLISITITDRTFKEIKIDIIVNNILGVINSQFLKVYANVRWIRNLGILVKQWGKVTQLIAKNALSSYAMILMLIHYLIKTKRVMPIIDARGRSIDSPHFKFKRIKLAEVEQFDVYYAFKTKTQDVTTIERVNYYKVLEGFMKYYAVDIWQQSDNGKIITVDQSTDREIDKETAITIKDPFDKPHNPGRLKVQNECMFKQAFKEAHQLLSSGKPSRIKDLFSKY